MFELYELSNIWKELVQSNAEYYLSFSQPIRAVMCLDRDKNSKGYSFFGQLPTYTQRVGRNIFECEFPTQSCDVLEGIYFTKPVRHAWLEIATDPSKIGDLAQKLDFDTKHVLVPVQGGSLNEALPTISLTCSIIKLCVCPIPVGDNKYSLPIPTYRGACVQDSIRQKLSSDKQAWQGYSIWGGLLQNQ